MRLLQECYLKDVQVNAEFLVDGTWYKKLDTGLQYCTVEVLTEYLLAEDENVKLQVGDTSRYTNELVVITEVPD